MYLNAHRPRFPADGCAARALPPCHPTTFPLLISLLVHGQDYFQLQADHKIHVRWDDEVIICVLRGNPSLI
jgi:hypothetical protein